MPKLVRELVNENSENSGDVAAISPLPTKVNSFSHKSGLGRTVMYEMVEKLCEMSFKPYETILKCGSYFRLEAPVLLWPPPTWYQEAFNATNKNSHSGSATTTTTTTTATTKTMITTTQWLFV